MPIGLQTPLQGHTGNGVTTTFAYNFGILAAADLKVRVAGSIVASGYSVTGIGNRAGGTVVFSTAPGAGVEVLLYRSVSRDRATDYQTNGDLRADVLDDDIDRIVMALQEDAEILTRCVRAPTGESLGELAAADSRANKVLTFGAGGAIALVDLAAFAGGGVVELVPADGSITLTKLAAAVQALINGALQKSGGTMTGALTLPGNAANALGAVPKQQAETIASAAAASSVADRLRVSLAASQPTTSGTAVDFTGVPSWAKRITVQLVGVSCAGAGYVGVRLGTGATPTYASSGYLGCAWQVASFLNFTDLAAGSAHNAAGDVRHGSIVLTRQAGNTWVASSVVGVSNGPSVGGGVSSITLGDVLTAVRLTTHNGDTFDAGSASILIEG